jgi:hypothetical protein
VSLSFIVSLVVGWGVLSLLELSRARRLIGALIDSGVSDARLGATVVESNRPLCLTVGLLRPRVLLSRRVLASLEARPLAVVLAHERSHVRRHDTLVAAVTRAASVFHLPRVRAWLLLELALAAEQSCDEAAAAEVGDRLGVAEAIVSVERLMQQAPAEGFEPMALAFGGVEVARRIESLLAEPLPSRSTWPFVAGGTAVAGGLLWLADELHHLTESALGVFLS